MTFTYAQLMAAVDQGYYVAAAPGVPGVNADGSKYPVLHVAIRPMDRQATELACDRDRPTVRFALAHGVIKALRAEYALPV